MVSNGEIKRSIQQYLNGVDHGNWIFYYENGNLEAKGSFKDGKRIEYGNTITQVEKFVKNLDILAIGKEKVNGPFMTLLVI